MNYIDPPSYHPPFWLRNGHVQSIYATISAPRATPNYHRQRIATEDEDFLDLDWSFHSDSKRSQNLVILSHGLEGHSRRNYITGMVQTLNRIGFDTLAWNYRGCSGTPNLKLRMYHNGTIDDLHLVVQHALAIERYKKVILVGFSMGGNLSLLYLGQMAEQISDKVAGAITFSVPCDLADASRQISRAQNQLYMQRFLKGLHKKINAKKGQYPKELNDRGYWKINNFKQFDDRYTAPIHGFKDAEDYWTRCSCLDWLKQINRPTLLVNSLDDPFLGKRCYPAAVAAQSNHLQLITPKYGGHVGFVQLNSTQEYWSETLCRTFIQDVLL